MSISRIENPNKISIIKRVGSVINVKNIVSKTIKSLPEKSLELILIVAFITTSFGELFGRNYSWKWYSLLILILATVVVKEIVGPKPKEEIKVEPTTEEKEINE